jgi:hypothetical protein
MKGRENDTGENTKYTKKTGKTHSKVYRREHTIYREDGQKDTVWYTKYTSTQRTEKTMQGETQNIQRGQRK